MNNKDTSFESEIMTTFIITYNPKKWSESKFQPLRDKFSEGSKVVERWKFGSHKKCKLGDRVFVSRTGQYLPGLVGSGYIVSPPYQEANFEFPDKLSWYVDVEFDYLTSSPQDIVISHEDISKLLNVRKGVFTPQKSGVSFKGDSQQLEEIWESLTKIELFKYAEEISDDDNYEFSEGAKQKITVNKYERDPKARAECIRIHGYSCKVCQFNFEEIYGVLGKEYIHVHHLVPLKDIGMKYDVDPENDLIPVCPNCHAMLHKLDDPSDIKGLIGMM